MIKLNLENFEVEQTANFLTDLLVLQKRSANSLLILEAPLKKWFEAKFENANIENILAIDERIEYGGYCNTCAYEEYVVVVYFKLVSGAIGKYTYSDTLSRFLKDLTSL